MKQTNFDNLSSLEVPKFSLLFLVFNYSAIIHHKVGVALTYNYLK